MVAQTLTANAPISPEIPNVQPSNTNTVEAPLEMTSTPTLTPTITLTPTPEGVFLVVSNDTYCRFGGPYSSFKILATVKAGETVKVLARNPENDSYFVQNPYDTSSTCWMYGKYATLSGNTDALPISTMHPTPTPTSTPTPAPGFTVTFNSLINCGPNYAFKLFIKNTGGLTWQSITLAGSDTVTAFAFSQTSNTFKEYTGCSMTLEQNDLTPGEESYVVNDAAGQFFNYDPTGHKISVTVTLCTTDGGAGTCKSIPISFTP
jgi:hypothetical protein